MYLSHIFLSAEAFCTLLLAIVAVVGDWFVNHTNLHIYKALFDNSTHSIIGGLTWFIVSLKLRQKTVWFRLSEVGLCALIASLIDVDHFLMARSVHLKDATNLQGRPPLHCTTVPIILTAVILLLSKYLVSDNMYHLGWIILAAFGTHHIRDASRRGLWFYQMGSTPPIPYFVYVAITMGIPHLLSYFMKMFYTQTKSYNDSIDI